MKKLLCIVTIIFVVFSVVGCDKSTNTIHKEGKYPTKWNDTEFYINIEDIDADIEKLKDWALEFKKYEGKLDTVDGLLGFIETDSSLEYSAIYDRLLSYANFGTSAFPLEEKYQYCKQKFIEAESEIIDARSYIYDEMASIPFKKRIALFSDDKLVNYIPNYSQYLYEDIEFASDEMVELYSNASLSHGRIRGVFDTFANFEIPGVEYKTKKGYVYITNRNQRSLLAQDIYSLEDKKAMNELWWANASQYKNTLTSLLEIDLLEQYSIAKVNGFDNTKQQAISLLGFDEDIIQMIIDYGHDSADKLADYYKLLADENGKYYFFNNYNMISSYKADYINYDDGVDIVLDALSIMGNDYIDILKEEINSGHVDVYPSDYKQPGAFEAGNYTGLYPFVMFNYNGTYSDISTIAHEMGHACYDILCNRNQTIYDWGASTFTHEVASLTNELIYYEYMIEHAKTNEEKLYHLQKLLACWTLNLYDSCYWQEFEQYCHEQVESGNSLNADDLCNKWVELGKEYYGEGLEQGEYGMYKWLTLPNLHNNYYEYSYATAVCYATVLSQNIINNVSNARENYMEFLKTGAATSSKDALKIAGIDIYDDNIYKQAFDYFENKVETFQELVNNQ